MIEFIIGFIAGILTWVMYDVIVNEIIFRKFKKEVFKK